MLNFAFRLVITPHEVSMILPLAVSLATKFWVYMTSFVYYWPVIYSPVAKLLFFVFSTGMWYFLYKSFKTDPGYIVALEEEKKKVGLSLAVFIKKDFTKCWYYWSTISKL